MAVHTKDTNNSTGTIRPRPSSQSISGNSNTSTSSSTNSSEFATEEVVMGLIKKCLIDMNELQKDIFRVEKEQDRTRDFYSGITALAKISKVAIFVLMIIPALQLIVCAALVYYLGIQEQLSGILNWVLGSVSVLSIIEIVLTAIKYSTLENKVDELEKKVEKLEDASNE